MKRYLVVGAKLAVAALLVSWLVYSGSLDFGALRVLAARPQVIAANLAILAFQVAIGAVRWRLLLRLADVELSMSRALQLHTTGLFFNIVIPGGIGGDVVKAVYVARDQEPAKRPTVYLIGFIDRLMGVAGLVVLALAAIAWRRGWNDPALESLAVTVAILVAATFGVPLVVLALIRRSTRLDRWSASESRLIRLVGQLAAAAKLVASRPAVLAGALALAVALHVSGVALFTMLAASIAGSDVAGVATVYPLGMLTLMIPVSYAGIGVGHVAFERLFEIVGLSGGATIFNVYFIGQTVPCLFGVLPYLALRRTSALPTAAEAALQQGS
jgi:uncharacterized protein (TIRG00374 family)